jgi:F0F1-type ATP synthase delta subunit
MEQLDLSDFFTTKPGATDFAARLATLSQLVYETGFNLENSLLEQFGIHKKDKFIELLRDNNVNVESNSALQEFMTKVCNKATSLPAVLLTLSFEPNETILREISSWFVLNTNRQVLLDIQVDPRLIAGAHITFNGQFRDFSAKAKFDQLLTDFLAGQPAEGNLPKG